MMLLIATTQALLLFGFTIASPVPQADTARTNPCPYTLFATSTTRSGHAYPQVTWSAQADNTIHYPSSFNADLTVAPSPANCMIVQGVPYCLNVAANSMANSLWSGLGPSAVAADVCPTPPWTTSIITATGMCSFLLLRLAELIIWQQSHLHQLRPHESEFQYQASVGDTWVSTRHQTCANPNLIDLQ